MSARRAWSPESTRLLQLAMTLLTALYMLLIGGTFDATLRFRVQLLNYVAGSLLALAWIALRLARRKRWSASGLELPLLFFAATQWVAVATSAQPRLSLEWAAGILVWGVVFCMLYDLLATGWPRAYITNALLVVAAVLAADGIWAAASWYLQWAKLGQLPPTTFRYFGLLGHANLTAGALNLLLPLAIVRAATSKGAMRLAVGALAEAMAATEFFTSSRAGWLACGAALATLGLLFIYQRGGMAWLHNAISAWRRQHWLVKTVSVVGLVLVIAAGGWLLVKQTNNITHVSILESRQIFWSAAWDLFKGQPLTGAGPDLFPWFYSRYVSIPPDYFPPHAHSAIFQILSGSGLLGLAGLIAVVAGAAWLLWRAWLAAGRSMEMAALMAGLVSVGVHQLFDYLFGTPIFPLLVVVVLALALAPLAGAGTRRRLSPLWLAPALLVPVGIFGFALRASYSNDLGLTQAASNHWPEAAAAFEQAAKDDPGLTLYAEEAAYAEAQAGQARAALALWRQTARADPYWAVLPASIGAVGQDAAEAQSARALAPRSALFALNAGAVAEAQGDSALETEAYTTALGLSPALGDGLYWTQNPQRTGIRDAWRARQPAAKSALTAGWAALASHDPGQAVTLFRQAQSTNPDSLAPYEGLARAYMALQDVAAAQSSINTGLSLPVTTLAETLGLHLAAGDLRAARGDQAGAMGEYGIVYSAVSNYNVDGPGSYGDTEREWQVFHRQALPAELVPQLPRADITAGMDQDFAKLAQWYRDNGQPATACLILNRVFVEAPQSISGAAFTNSCS